MPRTAGKRRLTPAEWAEIETLYELGTKTAAELSELYNVTPSALSQHFRKNGIHKGSRAGEIAKAVNNGVAAAADEAARKFGDERHKRIEDTKQQSYNDAVITRQLALRRVQESLKPGGIPLSTKELRDIQRVLDASRNMRYAILEIGKDEGDGELPVLPIRNLTEAEITEVREEQDEDGAVGQDPEVSREAFR